LLNLTTTKYDISTFSRIVIAKNSVLSIVALYRKPDEAMIPRNR